MGSETAMVDKIVSISHDARYVIEIENLEAFFLYEVFTERIVLYQKLVERGFYRKD